MDIPSLKQKYINNEADSKRKEFEERLTNYRENNENASYLSSELAYWSTLSQKVSEILKKIEQYEEAQSFLEGSDQEMKSLAEDEISKLKEDIETLEEEITNIQVEREFSDIDDNKPAILEIRAGAGGEEASLFAADLFRMYKNYAESKGWEVQIIDSSLSESGGYKEVIAHIKGKNVYKMLKYESGVHRVQRIPVTESSGRIHTSTVSVAVLPEAEEIDVQINPEDIHVEVMRASGAGGQCVNRTDSAVRITHIPTGIVVSCQETKHQAQNKEKAMTILRSRLYEKKKREEQEKRSNLRSSLIGSAMRAEKIRTYNFPQTRITDHRIKKSWFNVDSILDGALDEMLTDVREGIQRQLINE
jgi:peptide chain release factor 1